MVNGISGPVKDVMTDPEYLDISIPANTSFTFTVKATYTVFAYIYEGLARFIKDSDKMILQGKVVLFGDGEFVEMITTDKPAKLLLISGKPIGEKVAWYGPIVMNTREELEIAFEEYNKGTFIKPVY